MPISAVIFDMDGLLLDTERLCLDAFVETRRLFRLSDRADVYLNCVGLRGADVRRIIEDSLSDGVSYAEFNREWGQRIEAKLRQPIAVKAGAKELLKILAGKGFRLGVATSTRTETATDLFERAGLFGYFSCVVGGDAVGKPKPDPEVYHKVAERLGVVAQNCVAFEDSDSGTRAAVASGARTVQVPDLVPPSEDLRALGHLIAPDLIAGALAAGLI